MSAPPNSVSKRMFSGCLSPHSSVRPSVRSPSLILLPQYLVNSLSNRDDS